MYLEATPEAEDRAASQLLAALSPAQANTCRRFGYFDLTSNLGTRWRIVTNRSYIGNIMCLDEPLRGCWQGCSCCPKFRMYCMHLSREAFHPDYAYPLFEEFPQTDHFLAQALLLTVSEETFRRIAH